ncbi:MAG: hypothetical protein ABW105_17565 [Candidatus Thiodiazotropha sp. 6PLUC1]
MFHLLSGFIKSIVRQNYRSILSICLLLGLPLSAAAEDRDGSQASTEPTLYPPPLVQPCFPCHGPQGYSQEPEIPSIAGLPRDYLLKVLAAYRYGGRFGTIMDRLMAAYDRRQLEAMADYFSSQPFLVKKQDTDWKLVDKGRQLHRRYCRECHGDTDHPMDKGAPLLQGRWMNYLRWTIRDYVIGINQGDDEMSRQLSLLIRRHGKQGLEALIHYYGKGKP